MKNISLEKEINYSIRLLRIGIFSCHYQNRFGWFRLFGIGLKWKDINIHGLTFSERNGYRKSFKIGTWSICYLKKEVKFNFKK